MTPSLLIVVLRGLDQRHWIAAAVNSSVPKAMILTALALINSTTYAAGGVFINIHEPNNRKPGFSRFLTDVLTDRSERLLEVAVPLYETPSERAELEASRHLQVKLAQIQPRSLRFLYIHTHGLTKDGRTHLSGIGSIYEDGWGTMLERSLKDLRSSLAPEAVVIIGSCWHCLGQDASRRAESFARFLGMRNGILLGARNRYTTPTSVLPQSSYFDPSVGVYFLHELVRLGQANLATLYRFRDGRIVSNEEAHLDLPTIRGCTAELASE